MRLSPRIAVFALLIALPVVAKPTIRVEANVVVASGVTPSAQVAWFSIAWDRYQGMNRVTRRDRIDADTGTGQVTFTVDGGVPQNSIWVVVDLSSGEYAVATPEGTDLRLDTVPAGWLARGAQSAADAVQADRDFLELLVARPGVGAWAESVGRGGASDIGAGASAFTRASVAAMRPIGSTGPAPAKVLPGDVVVVIDPNAMECFAARLGAAL